MIIVVHSRQPNNRNTGSIHQQRRAQPPRCPALGKKCNKCKKEGHFAQVCKELSAEGSLLAAVEHDPPTTHGVHTYFESVELDSVSGTRKKSRSLITVKIAGKNVQIKADTGAEATVIPYELYKEITNKPLQKIKQPLKGWLAPKSIHPKGSVRLLTQYGSCELNLLYLVVDGNFTPLLGCDACLDLEVLEFMNVERITTAESKQPEQELPNFFQTDPVLQDYKDCFSDKPGKLPNKVHLEIDLSVPPVVHPPRKIPIALLEPAREKLTEMEEDGIIVKEEEHTPWVSSMLVIDKRKLKEKNTPLSKNDVRICIDPRNLNKALKRPHL